MPDPIVCSTTHLFHYLINPGMDEVRSFIANGIRPLSDFPDSERWQQLEREVPGFYMNLYQMVAADLLRKPYANSGIFITPIDFTQLPGTYLHGHARFRIPLDRIAPDDTVVTFVLDGSRVSLPYSGETMAAVADLWRESVVREWFGKDPTRMFFYVPQVAAYQGRIEVAEADFEAAAPA